jgi:succinylarginine dihydrolase
MSSVTCHLSPVTWNFDGLPGPTHNYAGLARGNLAAERHAQRVSNPREAARQGLAKMRALAARGFPQAVLPPHERPDVHTLRALGFTGTDAEVIARAGREAPRLLAACASAAGMWVANAATVSASADTADGRVHFTPANLVSNLHRAIEAPGTTRLLRAIFGDARRFAVHDPLPAAPQLGDEGAANHTRLARGAWSRACAPAGARTAVADDGAGGGARGVELFVYGRATFGHGPAPQRFPARQTREASEAVVRRHGLDPARVVLAQQDTAAIDAGVFHNDVIAVGEGRFLLLHEQAYVGQAGVLARLHEAMEGELVTRVVRAGEVTLAEAVDTYLFNSQLLHRDDGRYVVVAPAEAQEHARTRALLDALVAEGPVAEVLVFDLRQSMRNGGGPACLRLRVPLTAEERQSIDARVFLDDTLASELAAWIERHYRDRLAPADLADPALLDESRRALDELTRLLALPPVYPFQGA